MPKAANLTEPMEFRSGSFWEGRDAIVISMEGSPFSRVAPGSRREMKSIL